MQKENDSQIFANSRQKKFIWTEKREKETKTSNKLSSPLKMTEQSNLKPTAENTQEESQTQNLKGKQDTENIFSNVYNFH